MAEVMGCWRWRSLPGGLWGDGVGEAACNQEPTTKNQETIPHSELCRDLPFPQGILNSDSAYELSARKSLLV